MYPPKTPGSQLIEFPLQSNGGQANRKPKRNRLKACLLAGLSFILVPGTSFSAWEASYVDDGIARCIAAARKLKDLTKFGARSDGMCLIGGFMATKGELTWTCKLKAGKEYIFVACGDNDVKNLDLEGWEGKKLIVEDKEQNNVPVVSVTVEQDTSVLMKMKLSSAPENELHFCVMVMLENEGTGGSLGQLEKVAKQLNTACAKINDKNNLQFDQDSNSICIMACLLENEKSKTFYRNYVKGAYRIVGAGDENCKDFDLELLVDGKTVNKDTETNATPVLDFDLPEKTKATVKMIMHESTKPSFSVVGVLTRK